MSCSRVRRDRDREDRRSEGGRHSVDEKRRNVMWRVMTASSVPTVPWLTTPNKSSKAREILFVDEEDVKKFGVRGEFSLHSSRKTAERSATFRRFRESRGRKLRSRFRLGGNARRNRKSIRIFEWRDVIFETRRKLNIDVTYIGEIDFYLARFMSRE